MLLIKSIKRLIEKAKKYIENYPALKIAVGAALVLIVSYACHKMFPKKKGKAIAMKPLRRFLSDVEQGKVRDVLFRGKKAYYLSDYLYQCDVSETGKSYILSQLQAKDIPYCFGQSISSIIPASITDILISFSSSVLISSIIGHILSAYVFGLGKPSFLAEASPSKVTTFKDVFGLEKPKEVLQETIEFLKNPQKYEDVGCRLRRGIIFYGPPGTGKTLLAKATAGETNSHFISCSASEFCEMYVGVGAKRVRDLFQKAREYPSTIILIDEIDALGKRKTEFDASDSQRNSTLNQILTEMDGFNSGGNVLVIAATNRLQMIDPALIRAGRFDLKIHIPLPNVQQRKGILRLHLSKKKAEVSDQTINDVAEKSQNWSGADIESVCNEAAYKAIKKAYKSDRITDQDLLISFKDLVKGKRHQ